MTPPVATDPGSPFTAPFAGPADRVHFLDEQRRHRRASWRFSALAVLSVIVTGIPACIVATPLLFGVVLLLGHIANALFSLSPETWTALEGVAMAIPNAADAIDRGTGAGDLAAAVFAIALLVAPGGLMLLAIWLGIRRLDRMVGVGGAIERLGAREPDPRDAEERQVGNVVGEIAVAAGVAPPRVLILDTDAVNAAATGVGVDDATIIVTRGLLERLDRDETQAVVAHLVGSVGNGDLRILQTIFSIYQTWGALTLIMQIPLGPRARKTVWRALRTLFRSGGRGRVVDRWEAEFVGEAFLRNAVDVQDGDLDRKLQEMDGRPVRRVRHATDNVLTIVFGLASLVVQFAVLVSSMALIGPAVSFMWRRRRLLADAMAVQLTRNPTALARAVRRMAALPTVVQGGERHAFLFFTWSTGLAAQDAVLGQYTRMHPMVHRRHRRLVAQGAQETPMRPDGIWGKLDARNRLFLVLFVVVIGGLSAIALGLSVVVVCMLTMLSLMTMMVFLLAVWFGLKLVFVTIPGWIL